MLGLLCLTRLGLIVIEYDVKISDNEVANVEVKFRDNSRRFTRRSK
jgi:hypothetical protein